MRTSKGDGRVYQPKYERDGKVMLGRWRVRYTCGRKTYDEKLPEGWQNTKTAARDYLKQKWADIREGKFVAGAQELDYAGLRNGLLRYYEVNEKKSLMTARDGKTKYLKGQIHLDAFFKSNPRAIDITTSVVEEFKQQRKRDGSSNANANLSLGLLRQMFSVAVAEKRLAPGLKPAVKLLKAPAARKGFIEPEDAKRLYAALPDDLRAVARLGLVTGMRLGEVQKLKRTSVDLQKGEIHLAAEETKTGEARTIPLGETLEVLRFSIAKQPGPYVFGGARPLGNFRKPWIRACIKAGLGSWQETVSGVGLAPKRKYVGLTFHDLRRSAVRNFVRAGTSEAVAMKITGHKTRAVFDRYNITSTKDIHEAARLRDAYDALQNKSIEETGGKLDAPEAQTDVEKKSLIQ